MKLDSMERAYGVGFMRKMAEAGVPFALSARLLAKEASGTRLVPTGTTMPRPTMPRANIRPPGGTNGKTALNPTRKWPSIQYFSPLLQTAGRPGVRA